MQAPAPRRRGPGRPTLSNEQLLDKALDLFLEQGFERTSIDAITAVAGVAKRTVYQRYGDKETLFRAALQRAIEEWIVPIDQLRAVECDDLETTLLAVGRILVANIMDPAGLRLLRITNAESVRMPEIGAYSYQHGTERTVEYLADLFCRRFGANSDETGSWHEAATGFLYLVVSGPPTMTLWGLSLDAAAIERHIVYCVDLFLHGLRAQADAQAGREETQLREENQQLRQLLVAAMLELAALKEGQAGGESPA